MSDPVGGAEARHRIANLLHGYTEIADRKDVQAGVSLLGGARVRFPAGGFDRAADAEGFLTRLWASDVPHRHDVTNLVVEPAGGSTWRARAHYSRWTFTPAPQLHTLGVYDLLVDATSWRIRELTVTRTWTLA